MALDTKGFPPSREGAKSKVLKEILAYLDSRIGEGLKTRGPAALHVDVVKKPVEGSPEEEAAESPEEAAAEGDVHPGDDGPVEDEDAAKLLALAAKRGGKR